MAATRKITNDTMVECKNGTHGPLIYKSGRNAGYVVEWSEFGEVQDIDFGELLIMRGSQPRFFRDNWILIEDAEILKKLGVDRYYKNALTTDNFDDVFHWSAEDIRSKVCAMSDGMKDSIQVRAKELIKTGELDSRSVIKALNEVLHCDLEADAELEKKPKTKNKTVEVVTIA